MFCNTESDNHHEVILYQPQVCVYKLSHRLTDIKMNVWGWNFYTYI